MADFAERLVDQIARRPHGPLGRLLYRFPLGHKPGFDLVLERLPPLPSDHIVEVGCGGGVFMRRAVESGCRATAFDHSPAMVEATRRLNAGAAREGRLAVLEADAGALPLSANTADKVFCLNAFFFFPDPQEALSEMARVLKPGGQLAIITAPPEWREKIAGLFGRMASAMRFDAPATLAGWAQGVGLEPTVTLSAPKAGFLFIATKKSGS